MPNGGERAIQSAALQPVRPLFVLYSCLHTTPTYYYCHSLSLNTELFIMQRDSFGLRKRGLLPYARLPPANYSQDDDDDDDFKENFLLCPPFSPIFPTKSSPSEPPRMDHPGLPSHERYKEVEAEYLNSLHPKKRDKSLITQDMFERIWQVLHHPEDRDDTPQFRWWVRKMFKLSPGENDIESLVLHEDKPVATIEQLYDLLCYCHLQAKHGGRDRTLAVVRENYSWVPKRLTGAFVAACPTCCLKRYGRGPSSEIRDLPRPAAQKGKCLEVSEQQNTVDYPIYTLTGFISTPEQGTLETPPSSEQPPFSEAILRNSPLGWPSTGGLTDSSGVSGHRLPGGLDLHEEGLKYDLVQGRTAELARPASTTMEPLKSCSMSREVSLFDGMPNGFRYFEDENDCSFSEYKDHLNAVSMHLPQSKRARIPSVIIPQRDRREQLSGWKPQPSPEPRKEYEDKENIPQARTELPPLLKSLSDGTLGQDTAVLKAKARFAPSLPGSLNALRVYRPFSSGKQEQRRHFSMGSSLTSMLETPPKFEVPRSSPPQTDPFLLEKPQSTAIEVEMDLSGVVPGFPNKPDLSNLSSHEPALRSGRGKPSYRGTLDFVLNHDPPNRSLLQELQLPTFEDHSTVLPVEPLRKRILSDSFPFKSGNQLNV